MSRNFELAWLNLAALRAEHPDSAITWIDTEETDRG